MGDTMLRRRIERTENRGLKIPCPQLFMDTNERSETIGGKAGK